MSADVNFSNFSAHEGPLRILVVDDNEPSALSLTWAMELYGYEVRTCYDGRSALTEADRFDPDIVLLDLGMPIMDGLEACKRLRANPAHQETIVIAQTGWGDRNSRAQTKEIGFNYHLVKPISIDQLLEIIPPAVAQ
jgi:two-component system OmpR family response regulator